MALTGFNTWNPTDESAYWLARAKEVFEEYRDHLPLTGRQVFYRLVGAYGYPKDERAANKLYGILGRARRAGLLPFHWLRDGGGQTAIPQTFDDAADFWASVRSDFRHYSRNRQAGQPVFVELFCEAPGMMPQLQRAAFPYSVPVYGTRGFTGLSVVGEVARRALMRDVPTTILQVGDLDPSGVGIFETLAADVHEFVRQAVSVTIRAKDPNYVLLTNLGVTRERAEDIATGRAENGSPHGGLPTVEARRIALTWEQVEEHDLPTAPPSSKDSRSKNWPYAETAQAEALPPDLLAQIVRDAIEEELDMDRYHEEVDREEADRERIGARIDAGEED
ncbi:MAG TPA: hypothetical protein VF192_01485 [Longimicrobiales bacterium]